MTAADIRWVYRDLPREVLAQLLLAAEAEAEKTKVSMEILREAQSQRRVKIRVLKALLAKGEE